MKKKPRTKVGLLGGTFNPVHLGHLRAAEEIREILSLDKIYFIPAGLPPHKHSEEVAPSDDRMEMLELAVRGNPFFHVSDVELRRKGQSYTVDTLSYFSSTFPGFELYFILGTDLFSRIDTWKDYTRLFELSNFAVITRPGFSEEPSSVFPLVLKDDFRYYKRENSVIFYRHKNSNLLAFIQIEGIEVSSTQIRNLVADGKSIKYLVPEEVESFVSCKNLYKEAAFDKV